MGIGIDFGTTNSSLAVATADGVTQLAQFPMMNNTWTESYRSLLYLQKIHEASTGRDATPSHERGTSADLGRAHSHIEASCAISQDRESVVRASSTKRSRTTIRSWSGPQGIEHYLAADDEKGRLVQSLKSFLSSRGLQSTEVFGRRMKLEDLVSRILRDIRERAKEQFQIDMRRAIVGRPVRFVGADTDEDDDYAVSRLKNALESAGFEEVQFEYEPIAAAYYYEARLDHDELILIGDFGGGTSDFSLLNVGPSHRRHEGGRRTVLGNEGLGLAGDAFDARIVRHLVSPELGARTQLQSGGKLLPVPNWVYHKLERWHHLSLLKSQETLNMLQSVAKQALEPEKIQRLLYLIQHDLGYHLHRAVQQVKLNLSECEASQFRFVDGDVELIAQINRAQFEGWIEEELQAIAASVTQLLDKTGVAAQDVDRVFLTGGSSFVPAVRRIFEQRFGAARIRTGDEFTSVARGLALRSLE